MSLVKILFSSTIPDMSCKVAIDTLMQSHSPKLVATDKSKAPSKRPLMQDLPLRPVDPSPFPRSQISTRSQSSSASQDTSDNKKARSSITSPFLLTPMIQAP